MQLETSAADRRLHPHANPEASRRREREAGTRTRRRSARRTTRFLAPAAMRKKSSPEQPPGKAGVDVELLKAVAQAWHAQSGNPRPSSSSRAPGDDDDRAASSGARHRRARRHGPSRFKLEAEAAAAAAATAAASQRRSWDFAQSLWDTYELVAVAQKLECSLVIAEHMPAAAPCAVAGGGGEEGPARGRGRGGKRARESSRSLRSLFLRSSSRRFDEPSN